MQKRKVRGNRSRGGKGVDEVEGLIGREGEEKRRKGRERRAEL